MNKQKGFIGAIVLIILALVVVGGGYYVYQKEQLKKPVNFNPQISNTDKTIQNTTTTQNNEPNTTVNNSSSALKQNGDVSSLSLNINTKPNYHVDEYLTGATYNVNYTGPSFDSVILYKQSYKDTAISNGTTLTSVTYSTDFHTIKTGGITSNVSVLYPATSNIVINGQVAQPINVFSNEGDYVLTMSIYKCSDLITNGIACSSKNVPSSDDLKKQTPFKSISKTITVLAKEQKSIPEGKTLLDCAVDTKDPLCAEKFIDLFQKNLTACNPSTGHTYIGWEPVFGIIRSYTILGTKNNVCVINFGVLKTSQTPPSFLDKTMTCTYSDSERTMDNVAGVKNCTGQLYDAIKNSE